MWWVNDPLFHELRVLGVKELNNLQFGIILESNFFGSGVVFQPSSASLHYSSSKQSVNSNAMGAMLQCFRLGHFVGSLPKVPEPRLRNQV